MQGLWRTVSGFAQISCQGTKTFSLSPSKSAVQLKCVCGFKSVTNPVKRISLRQLEKSDSILHEHSQFKTSLRSFGCSQNSKPVTSFQGTHPDGFDSEAPASSTVAENMVLSISRSNADLWLFTSHSSPRLYTNGSAVLSSSPTTVFAVGNQIRYISNHSKRRHSRRKDYNRTLSTHKNEQETSHADNDKKETEKPEEDTEVQPTLYQRFKKTYREHGKVLVAVHVLTSAVWFGSFYTAARCGIDIVPYLENWNFSERIISPFRSGGLGDVALAYLMYKLATPARYTVTIGGTNLAIRYLRKEGKMDPVPEGHTLRELYKEGKEDLKNRSQQRMNKIRRIRRRRNRHKHKDNKD